MRNLLVTLTVASLVSGCSDKYVEAVKNSFPDNSNQKYSQILDNRQICINSKWKSTEESNGRVYVQYECTFIQNDRITKKITSWKLDEVQQNATYFDKKYNQTVEFIVQRINQLSNYKYSDKSDLFSAEEHEKHKLEKEQENKIEMQELNAKLERAKEFKGKYYSEIEKYKSEAENGVTSYYSGKFSVKQILTFDTSGAAPKITSIDFLINDKKYNGSFDDIKLLGFEFITPQNQSIQDLWWEQIQGKLGALYDLKIHKFPLSCDFEQGCPAVQ